AAAIEELRKTHACAVATSFVTCADLLATGGAVGSGVGGRRAVDLIERAKAGVPSDVCTGMYYIESKKFYAIFSEILLPPAFAKGCSVPADFAKNNEAAVRHMAEQHAIEGGKELVKTEKELADALAAEKAKLVDIDRMRVADVKISSEEIAKIDVDGRLSNQKNVEKIFDEILNDKSAITDPNLRKRVKDMKLRLERGLIAPSEALGEIPQSVRAEIWHKVDEENAKAWNEKVRNAKIPELQKAQYEEIKNTKNVEVRRRIFELEDEYVRVRNARRKYGDLQVGIFTKKIPTNALREIIESLPRPSGLKTTHLDMLLPKGASRFTGSVARGLTPLMSKIGKAALVTGPLGLAFSGAASAATADAGATGQAVINALALGSSPTLNCVKSNYSSVADNCAPKIERTDNVVALLQSPPEAIEKELSHSELCEQIKGIHDKLTIRPEDLNAGCEGKGIKITIKNPKGPSVQGFTFTTPPSGDLSKVDYRKGNECGNFQLNEFGEITKVTQGFTVREKGKTEDICMYRDRDNLARSTPDLLREVGDPRVMSFLAVHSAFVETSNSCSGSGSTTPEIRMSEKPGAGGTSVN
ncbi:MAG: hypothetical protein AB7O96_12295, partial [Pseudobdellovibrionaceae bacterium]